MSSTTRRVAWVVLGLVAVTALVLGASRGPTTGSGDDRLYALTAQLKCLQCAGESVANSNAEIAVEMRTDVRRQMKAGRTDDEILTYFADRYGQRVLLNPSNRGLVALVWILPVLLVGGGAAGLWVVFSRWSAERGAAQVTDADRELVESARRIRHEDEQP